MQTVDFTSLYVAIPAVLTLATYVVYDFLRRLNRRYIDSKASYGWYDRAVSAVAGLKRTMTFSNYMTSIDRFDDCSSFESASRAFSRFVGAAMFVFCAWPAVFGWLRGFEFFASSPCLTIVAGSYIVSTALSILDAPFELYDTFRLDEKYGFNTQTLAEWLNDFWKSHIIASAEGSALIVLAYYGISAFITCITPDIVSPWFVISACAAAAVIGLFQEWIYINVVSRIFNKFTPLDDEELTPKIKKMISDAGFSVGGVYVVDEGRRSRYSNAYFTGWGRSKRIVLYDNLLKNHTKDEVLAILAHETGHLVHRDIIKGRLIDAVMTAATVAFSIFIATDIRAYHAFGFGFVDASNIHQWYLVGFSIAGLVIESVSWLLEPLFSWISRRDEYAADAWAVDHAGADAVSSALVKLYASNLSTIYCHPWYENWFYGHPSFLNRLRAVKERGNGMG